MIYDKQLLNGIKSESYVSPKVERKKIHGRGYGLFSKEFISRGEIVSVSGGIIISKTQFEKFQKLGLDYAYQISDHLFICPLNPEDPSDDWRMNHCCEPNCGLDGNIIFVAIKDIESGSELTYDYCMTESDPTYSVELSCNKKTCRKTLTGSDWKKRELQDKYGSFFSNYLKNKIKHYKNYDIE